MSRRIAFAIAAVAVFCLVAAGVHYFTSSDEVTLANPAAVWCKEMGYSYEIRTNDDGGQYGVCIFPNGTEQDAWKAYNEAHPASMPVT
jgi:putative hemolysin